MRYSLLAVASLLTLAVCNGGNPPTGPDEAPTVEAASTGARMSTEAGSNPADEREPANMPSSANRDHATEKSTTRTIPAPVQGRWGLVPVDCEPGRSDAKGLLVIGPTQLRFYESIGTLAEFKEIDPGRIRARFSFTGEGMSWSREEVLGPVAVSPGPALRPKIASDKAQGAGLGHSKVKSCNAGWRDFGSQPFGTKAIFPQYGVAARSCSSLHGARCALSCKKMAIGAASRETATGPRPTGRRPDAHPPRIRRRRGAGAVQIQPLFTLVRIRPSGY